MTKMQSLSDIAPLLFAQVCRNVGCAACKPTTPHCVQEGRAVTVETDIITANRCGCGVAFTY